MKILIDTNVVLDLLLDREPWSHAAALLFSRAEIGRIEAHVCATTVTTIHYLARKVLGEREARKKIRQLLTICGVTSVNRAVVEAALDLDFGDFEDAVLHESARQSNVDAIVTRDVAGFKKAEIAVLAPGEMLRILAEREQAGDRER